MNNSITPAALVGQLNNDAVRVRQLTTKRYNINSSPVIVPHEQILQNLLDQIKPISFREEAGLDADDHDSKLSMKHYLVIAVEMIGRIASSNKWDLRRQAGFIYIFNGVYWKAIDKDTMRAFLQQAAEKMGIEKHTARHYEFGDKLFRQFCDSQYLPSPDPSREIVKINLANGTFEIRSEKQQLRAPDPADFLTYQLPFGYDPEATAPQFTRFLNRVLPDLECQRVLAEAVGYLFVSPARLKLEKAVLLYGSGANGKSVVFEIVTALLGSENVSHYSLQSLTTPPAYCRAYLGTKLVNYASEISSKVDADMFKQLASGEPIEVRVPYGEPYILREYAKLMFNCNELPTDVEHTNAFYRRFLIFPFTETIPESEQDTRLASKIIENELPGVFNWVLQGLHRLLEKGRFSDSDAVRQQLETYRTQSDSVRLFLDETGYQKSPDTTPLKDVYRDYKAFCIEDGYRPVNNRNFQKRLQSVGIPGKRLSSGNVVYVRRIAGTSPTV